MENRNKTKDKILIFSWVVLALAFIMLVVMNIAWGDHWLDSDMAAEMMFSKLIAEEGGFFTTANWYYSTEYRVLYTQLFMVPLFHVCKDWQVIRSITNVLTYITMLCSYFYFMKPLKCKKSTVVLSSVILLLPFSETMVTHMQMGNTYMPHVIIVFFMIGMFLRLCTQEKLLQKKRLPLLFFYIVLSIVCGMSGVRYLLAIQGPLVLTAVFFVYRSEAYKVLRTNTTKENVKKGFGGENLRYLFYSMLGAFCAVAGYGINVVIIASKFYFQTYDVTNFIRVFQGVLLERTQDTIANILMLFGYIQEKGFLSLRGMISMIAFVLLIGIVILVRKSSVLLKEADEKECPALANRKFIRYFFAIAFILNTFVFIFTTSTIVSRYYITVFIFVLPLLCFYFDMEKSKWDKTIVFLLLAFCLGLSTMKCVYSFIDKDKNAEEKLVVAYLEENGYDFGYASYWNANIMTELSDGKVEIANINKFEDMSFFLWSTPRKYYDRDYHEGKAFVLMTLEEYQTYNDNPVMRTGQKVYEDNTYVVLHYNTTEEIIQW